jgi:hypothetical protein
MKEHKDRLSEAVARLKQQGQAQDLPKKVVEETLRSIADCRSPIADSGTRASSIHNPQFEIRNLLRFAAAAAVFVLVGYTAGKLSTPKPMNPDQLCQALIPSVASAIEPALRQRVAEGLRRDYQLALAGLYVRVKEELTEQYRSDLNRFAIQTLAASNATTNELLTQLVQSLDTAKTQDLRRIAQALSEIENNRVQDKTQLASGLQTLAYRTEDELSRTKNELAQLLVAARPAGLDLPAMEP